VGIPVPARSPVQPDIPHAVYHPMPHRYAYIAKILINSYRAVSPAIIEGYFRASLTVVL